MSVSGPRNATYSGSSAEASLALGDDQPRAGRVHRRVARPRSGRGAVGDRRPDRSGSSSSSSRSISSRDSSMLRSLRQVPKWAGIRPRTSRRRRQQRVHDRVLVVCLVLGVGVDDGARRCVAHVRDSRFACISIRYCIFSRRRSARQATSVRRVRKESADGPGSWPSTRAPPTRKAVLVDGGRRRPRHRLRPGRGRAPAAGLGRAGRRADLGQRAERDRAVPVARRRRRLDLAGDRPVHPARVGGRLGAAYRASRWVR